MRKHLMIATLSLVALTGTARAQAPEGAPPSAPPDPNMAPPPPSGGAAAADTASQFGQLGQIAISGELEAALVHESTSMGGTSVTAVAIQPSLDYFVMPNVSIGGALSITHGSFTGNGDVTAIGILARGGYNLHLAPMVSLWPQLQLGYLHQSFSGGGMSASGYTIPLQIFAPFLIHVTTHLFVGIGPVFSTELVAKVQSMDQGKTTDIGITSVVGGYFGP